MTSSAIPFRPIRLKCGSLMRPALAWKSIGRKSGSTLRRKGAVSNPGTRDFAAELTVAGQVYRYYSLAALEHVTGGPVSRLPVCLKLLAENLMRQHAAGLDRSED